MTLPVNKINYSQRHGLMVEFDRPGTLCLPFEQVCIMLMILKGHLTQAEIDEQFTVEEQKVLDRAFKLDYEKMVKIGEKYNNAASVKLIVNETKRLLTWWSSCWQEGETALMQQFYGWKIPAEDTSSMMDRMIRKALQDGDYDRLYFTHLLKEKSWGNPSPSVMQALEARYGEFNLDSI